MKSIGNIQLLNTQKIAFLCSDKYSSKSVLASYDWVSEIKKQKRCVISGFQSRLEMDILDILLQGTSPIVMVLARSIFVKCPAKYRAAVESGQMLIVSPFDDDIPIVTRERARIRNLKVIELADEIVVGHINQGGMLEGILLETEKGVVVLDK
ncbi:MAG: hypothetical protein J1F68_01075 [Clostridiales bacterium]|nr:hypothetical protein [Clostridiales bacterium]